MLPKGGEPIKSVVQGVDDYRTGLSVWRLGGNLEIFSSSHPTDARYRDLAELIKHPETWLQVPRHAKVRPA